MAARDRDDLGTRAMEIASHARALAVTSLRDSQPVLTSMTAISILAMASVIYLFGGYVDWPNEQRTSTAVRIICKNLQSQSTSDEKEIMIMNPKRNSIAAWRFSTWFALLSPVIGVLLGLFGAFLFLR
jgi:hypothetical protein